jgi:hypothetical protein
MYKEESTFFSTSLFANEEKAIMKLMMRVVLKERDNTDKKL